jgi:hypothetical protein
MSMDYSKHIANTDQENLSFVDTGGLSYKADYVAIGSTNKILDI